MLISQDRIMPGNDPLLSCAGHDRVFIVLNWLQLTGDDLTEDLP